MIQMSVSSALNSIFPSLVLFVLRMIIYKQLVTVASRSKKFLFNLHSGGWSSNWVHSARRPFILGLLYLPRRHFVHHKSHLTRPGLEPGPPRWEASD
jgi:hypothetical protein